MIIQNLILAMSLSGSVIVLLYLITCPLAKPYVPVKWKFLILKLAVVFYLVPFPLYMEHSLTLRRLRRMNPLMRKLFPPLEDRMPYIRKQAEKLSVLIDDSGYAVFSRELKVMAAITALLLLIVFVLLTWNLIRYANEEWKKNWKKQTLNTYLNNLQRIGLVGIDKRATPHYLYYALCTKEELIRGWTRKVVEEYFDNSISSFVMAFTGKQKLSEAEAEKLKKLLE